MDEKVNSISHLEGKTIAEVRFNSDNSGLLFIDSDDRAYCMGHEQDCCEWVRLEDTCGSWDDIIGQRVVHASERNSHRDEGHEGDHDVSATWTFYVIATLKGTVTLRWLGESNGYYSEQVDFMALDEMYHRDRRDAEKEFKLTDPGDKDG